MKTDISIYLHLSVSSVELWTQNFQCTFHWSCCESRNEDLFVTFVTVTCISELFFLTIALTWLLQVMVTNVTSLLKTVKAVEDEATKGTRALEATIEHIKQELTVSDHTL